jgi:toxin ParE1/3/4
LNIRWLDRAVIDLEDAFEFILYVDPSAAAAEVDRVLKSVERLKDNPAMGKAGRIPKTRELAVSGTPYFIIYRVKNDRLEILRIFHGARRPPHKARA